MSEDLVTTTTRLLTAGEAAAALLTRMRIASEGIDADPEMVAALDGVVEALGIDRAAITAARPPPVVLLARALLTQAVEMLADPGRAPGWTVTDPSVLQSIGMGSAFIADVVRDHVVGQLAGAAAALDAPGAAILDVGAGVAGLAIGFSRVFPQATVTGLEPWRPSFDLAVSNVAAAGLTDRIVLRADPVEALTEERAWDLAFFAAPFIPTAVVPEGLARVKAALRPGGWLLFGMFGGPPDPVARAVATLRTVRSGGHVYTPPEAEALLTAAGFVDVRTLTSAWSGPIRFTVGR